MRALPIALVVVLAALPTQAEEVPPPAEATAPPLVEPAASALATDAPADAPPPTPQEATTVVVPAASPSGEVLAVAPPPVALPAEGEGVACPTGTALCWQSGVVAVWPKLRVRPGFEYVDADPQILYIGSNDGFFLDSARLGVEGNVADLVQFKLTLDAASLFPGGGPNQPVTPLSAAARDAWVAWTPSTWFMVRGGQQNMPSDYEGGDVDALIPFTRRSVLANGVRAGHGNSIGGLSPARQIGVVVGSRDDAVLADFPVEYRLGIANGNGLNQLGNDNKLPAAYVRLGSGFGDLVRVGIGGRFNPRTVGSLPNLYSESDVVGFADASLTMAGLELVTEGVGRQTSLTTVFPDANNPAGQESAWGVAWWVGYTIGLDNVLGAPLEVKPALRMALYDPSSAFSTDQLLESTVGVRLDGDKSVMPLSFLIDYTLLTELGDLGGSIVARDLANNRLTALLQIEL